MPLTPALLGNCYLDARNGESLGHKTSPHTKTPEEQLINPHQSPLQPPSSLGPHIQLIMSHSSLDSPTEILQQAASPPPYTPPPLQQLSHKQRLQWRESAKDLMDATIDKWTYPSLPLTTLEDIHNSAKIAARMAKIWALAQSDPTQHVTLKS